jgi:Sulfatase
MVFPKSSAVGGRSCCSLVFLATLAGMPAQADDKPPPNVLLIIADDMGWTDCGFMGHPHIRTPRLDRLSRSTKCFAHSN